MAGLAAETSAGREDLIKKRSRNAFRMTMRLDDDMAIAAIIGVASPRMAMGTATKL